MAGSAEHDKHEFVTELAAARARISAAAGALRQSLDVPARARESFKRHRPTWLGGAAIVGFVLSKLPSRKKTVFVERTTGNVLGAAGKLGALFSAVKFAITVARPLLSELPGGGLGEILRRFHRPAKAGDQENVPKPRSKV